MDGKTHLIAGGITGVGLAYVSYQMTHSFDLWEMLYITGGALVGSLLPDTDTNKSLMGRYVPLWIVFGHRRHTHSLFFTGIVAGLGFLLKMPPALIAGLTGGILSHLFLDFLTPMKLPYLTYPFFFRRGKLKMRWK